ncbi:MAG: hypothetical protein R3C28_32185 [Pirellulaceae bacterium]
MAGKIQCFWRVAVLMFLVGYGCTTVNAQGDYGGIEIGSEGVKRIVGHMTDGVFESVSSQEKTTNLGLVGALVTEPSGNVRFQADAIQSLGEVLDEFLGAFQRQNIPPSRVFVAVSSGLAGKAGAETGEINATLQPLNDAVRDRIGRDARIVTPPEEARWTFNGIVQQEQLRSSTLVIDVGGGNSKFATETQQSDFPLGARTFAAQATTNDVSQLRRTSNQELRAAFDKMDLSNVRRIYLTGGSAFISTVLAMPQDLAQKPRSLHRLGTGKTSSLTKVLNSFGGKSLISDVFDPLIASETDGEAKNLLTRAKGIYDLDRLRCGVTLLEQSVAIVQSYHLNQTIPVDFYGDGQVAWMKGFMQEQLQAPSPDPDPALKSIERFEWQISPCPSAACIFYEITCLTRKHLRNGICCMTSGAPYL